MAYCEMQILRGAHQTSLFGVKIFKNAWGRVPPRHLCACRTRDPRWKAANTVQRQFVCFPPYRIQYWPTNLVIYLFIYSLGFITVVNTKYKYNKDPLNIPNDYTKIINMQNSEWMEATDDQHLSDTRS